MRYNLLRNSYNGRIENRAIFQLFSSVHPSTNLAIAGMSGTTISAVNRKITTTISTSIKTTKHTFMKAKYLITIIFFCFINLLVIQKATAQVTVVSGPSDNTSVPPSSSTTVNQVLASGAVISLKIGSAATTATNIRYQWYKWDRTGTKQLVQDGADNTLRETATGAGYYTYQLVMSNSNQCSSDISDPFKVYVLPVLNPTITASSGTVCSNTTSTSTLTVNAGSSNYIYLYQWVINGTDISGATAATYTTPASTTGNNTYSVRVSYALNSNYGGTATQVVNMIPVPSKPAISVGQ